MEEIVKKHGGKRLLHNVYNTDGTTYEEFSFYDPGHGCAARTHGKSKAIAECAAKSIEYNDMLQ